MVSFIRVALVIVSLHNNGNTKTGPSNGTCSISLIFLVVSLAFRLSHLSAHMFHVSMVAFFKKKKNDFFPGSHQLSIAPQLGVGAHEFLRFLCWVVNLIFNRSCAGNHSCYEFMSTLSCPIQKRLFLSSPPLPLVDCGIAVPLVAEPYTNI